MLVTRNGGFSVLELMIVVAIVGLLAAVALPSFQQVLALARIKTVASDIHLSLMRARSEAIKQNTNITVAATGGSWLSGWTVSNNVENHEAIGGSGVTISGTANITYTPNGRTTSYPVAINLTSSNIAIVRCITVGLSGQPLIKDSTCT